MRNPTARRALPVYNCLMTRGVCWLMTVALAVLLASAAPRAHHSFAAEYDANKPITLTGAVVKVEWLNPHVRFYIDVKEAGKTTQWELTMGGPNGLLRRGWKRTMLKPGETVTVNGYLARDGSKLANVRIVTLPDGQKMFGGTAPDAPPN